MGVNGFFGLRPNSTARYLINHIRTEFSPNEDAAVGMNDGIFNFIADTAYNHWLALGGAKEGENNSSFFF